MCVFKTIVDIETRTYTDGKINGMQKILTRIYMTITEVFGKDAGGESSLSKRGRRLINFKIPNSELSPHDGNQDLRRKISCLFWL